MSGATVETAMEIRPFQVEVPEGELADLRPAHRRNPLAREGDGRGRGRVSCEPLSNRCVRRR